MLRSVIGALVAAPLFCGAADAHALFPGSQVVETFGDRAFISLHAVNSRKDVSTFVVEIFDYDTWEPSRVAVATPWRLNVPAEDPNATSSQDHPISVLVDLNDQPRQRLRVCTRSVNDPDMLRPRITEIATRVCSNVTVQRYGR